MGGSGAKSPEDTNRLAQLGVISKYAGQVSSAQDRLNTFLGKGPPDVPDFSDPAVQAGRQAALVSAKLARGRKASFLTQDQGTAFDPPIAGKTFLGS